MSTTDIENDSDESQLRLLLSKGSISQLNDELTVAMSQQRHQALIKGDRLETLVQRVVELSAQENIQSSLVTAAVLGRLAAVARGREAQVLEHIPLILKSEPAPIDTLSDGDEKYYASTTIGYAKGEWVKKYCLQEAIATDTAEKARKELLSLALYRCNDASAFFQSIAANAHLLLNISNPETKIKRVRRILIAINDCFAIWRGDINGEVGGSLSIAIKSLIKGELDKVDEITLYGVSDQAVSILLRIIELRFSFALHAETYALSDQLKRKFGARLWNAYLSSSKIINDLRICMLESTLVLARQGKTDKQVIDALLTVYSSREQVSLALSRHFNGAKDIEPEIREWWLTAGVVSSSQREPEHRLGNSEDEQIGALLIEVETSKEAMERLRRAVVPLLQISDPVLAATVEKAASGYAEIAQISRRLARMRKLTKTDAKGHSIEYNPLEHEMLGGHQHGIRKVKVIRDGVLKEFGGKIKTLVKARVEKE